MSNIVAHNHLVPCASVAVALLIAFIVVSMPKPDTAVSTTHQDAKISCLQSCCLQAWPYYERSCLSDSRQDGGNVRAVRVIALNGQALHHASRQ